MIPSVFRLALRTYLKVCLIGLHLAWIREVINSVVDLLSLSKPLFNQTVLSQYDEEFSHAHDFLVNLKHLLPRVFCYAVSATVHFFS